jgi:hypothetical protein
VRTVEDARRGLDRPSATGRLVPRKSRGTSIGAAAFDGEPTSSPLGTTMALAVLALGLARDR